MTINKKSNQTGSKISTSFLASHEYCQYITTVTNPAQTESQKLDESKKNILKNLAVKTTKQDLLYQKKKIAKDTNRILENQNNPNSHDLERVEFLDSLNFESVDIDEEYINYLDQSI